MNASSNLIISQTTPLPADCRVDVRTAAGSSPSQQQNSKEYRAQNTKPAFLNDTEDVREDITGKKPSYCSLDIVLESITKEKCSYCSSRDCFRLPQVAYTGYCLAVFPW